METMTFVYATLVVVLGLCAREVLYVWRTSR